MSNRFFALVATLAFLGTTSISRGDATVQFNRDVRPILSDRCFACHGPDEKTREADLRLDLRDSAIEDRGGYQAIAPGEADHSELLERITSTDADLVMPPPGHGQPLNEQEIAILKDWIEVGAPYEQHWAYRPVTQVTVPSEANDATTMAIDAFVRERLRAANVESAHPASPRVLARRLSFDLTGLPPDPDTVARFVRDPSPSAYAELVDAFLHSPHFGERMAMYWLDLVRYADTLGYHGDQERSVSPYRDYVIDAFNDNKPFDQFTTEQLAGDLLPHPTLEQRVASTYNRLNRASGEGGVQPKEYLAKYSADRVRTTGAVWLGSTFGCAECHDHKFDPFTTKDFYSFAAFFADIKEQGIVRGANHIEQLPVPTPEQAQRRTELQRELRDVETAYAANSPELTAAREEWEQAVASSYQGWRPLTPVVATSANGAKLTIEKDGVVVASGKNPDRDSYTLAFSDRVTSFAGLRLELLPDPSLPAGGPGRASNGNFVIHRITATLDGTEVPWESASATHSQTGHSPEHLLNGKPSGWAILPQTGQVQRLTLIAAAAEQERDANNLDNGAIPQEVLELQIEQNHGNGHNVGRFRVYIAEKSIETTDGPTVTSEILDVVQVSPKERTPGQKAALDTAFREWTPLLAEVRARRDQLQESLKRLDAELVTTLATTATTPRTMRVLPRGNWMDDSGAEVLPAVPAFLGQPDVEDDRRLNRLDLARWLVDRDNPLVARTFVNRLWMLFFGQGLCRTVDDLGSQGGVPTHPELLDWLALEFIESGWDVKHMVRLMVLSQTYQQSSQVSAATRNRDPMNRLFARQSSWRLEAEMIRDNALSVSGLLVDEIGGVSVKPYQPAGYWAQLNFPKRRYQADTGTAQYRRGLYTHWQRTFLHPSLLAFDAPAREECTARRDRSNTPLQSLVLLNDPTYVEAARKLAERVLVESNGEFEQRLAWLYNQTLARAPRENEISLLRPLFEESLATYREAPEAAQELVAVGYSKTVEQTDPVQLAAWMSVTRSVMNLHEFITRY